MKDNLQSNLQNQSQSDKPAWVAFSIGAISGVIIFLILSFSNRLKSTFQRSRGMSQINMGSEIINGKDGSLKDALLSPLQPGNESDGLPTSKSGKMLTTRSGFSDIENKTRAIEGADTSSASATKANSPYHISESILVVGNTGQVSTNKRWSTPTRYIMGVFLFIAILAVLFIGRSTIPMVVAAALLAVVLDPLIKFLSRRLKYNLAVGLVYFLVVVLLLAFPLLAIPPLVDAVNFVTNIDYALMTLRLGEWIQNILTQIQANPAYAGILTFIQENAFSALENIDSQALSSTSQISLSFEDLIGYFGKAFGTVTGVLGPTFGALVSIFFTLLISLQMTLTAKEMKNWYADLIPPGYGPELSQLITNIRRSWTGFLHGQIYLMLTIGMITWLGGVILGLPQAFLLGVIAGIMELIPSVGPVIAAIPAVLFALLFGSIHYEINHLVFAIIVIGFYVLVQLLENQILVPRIMGDAVDLPPLVVLIGIVAGAGAFGILGALLAVPVIATGNLVFRYIYGKIIEAPPIPPPIEEPSGILNTVRSFISRMRRPGSKNLSRASKKEKLL